MWALRAHIHDHTAVYIIGGRCPSYIAPIVTAWALHACHNATDVSAIIVVGYVQAAVAVMAVVDHSVLKAHLTYNKHCCCLCCAKYGAYYI